MVKKCIMSATAVLCGLLLICKTEYTVFASDVLKDVAAGAGKYAYSSHDEDDAADMPSARQTKSEVLSAGAGGEVMTIVDNAAEVVTFESTADVSESVAAEEEQDEFANLCVANVENNMNVRKEPNEDALLAGYLYKDCVSEIIEQRDGWTHVKSGNLDGWAKDDFLVFGDDAKTKIEEGNRKIATITTETLRVRADADENADITALLGQGVEVRVVESEDEWTKVRFDDGTEGAEEGYVSNDYISIGYDFQQGETMEEVNAREKKEKEQKEAAAKASEKLKKSSGKSGAEKVKESVAAAAENNNGAQTTATNVTNNGAASASVDDETLLAALIQCECGNDIYEGQLAVGAVVMNRARGSYGSIRNAIYAPGQFGPASSGKLAVTLSTGAIGPVARQAAKDAISGVSNIGTASHFRNARSGHAGVVVGHHVFW
ncbi:MAG: cell wall hydrolase [Lachnospiraceae bacterium]|nr:cell wall hydrolase [Lachnospiraceae bacterium]